MPVSEASIADVVKSAIHDAQDLVRSEIALAKAEVRGEIRGLGAAAAMLAAAAIAAVLGLVFLLTAVAWALSEILGWPVWSGFAIVTALMLVAAGVLAYLGRSRISAQRHMPLTTETLKENIQWMRARTS